MIIQFFDGEGNRLFETVRSFGDPPAHGQWSCLYCGQCMHCLSTVSNCPSAPESRHYHVAKVTLEIVKCELVVDHAKKQMIYKFWERKAKGIHYATLQMYVKDDGDMRMYLHDQSGSVSALIPHCNVDLYTVQLIREYDARPPDNPESFAGAITLGRVKAMLIREKIPVRWAPSLLAVWRQEASEHEFAKDLPPELEREALRAFVTTHRWFMENALFPA